MDDDGIEEWLAASPDDIPGALAFAQGDRPPGKRSVWPILMALLAMLLAMWLLR